MWILITYLISITISSGEKNCKCFIGYLNNDYKIKTCIMLPKISPYVKRYDSKTKWIYFLIEDDKLFKKYDIWNKVSISIKKT